MIRERALKVVLVIVGLLFIAGIYPLAIFFAREPSLAMMLSLYVTLGIFLLLAARDPVSNRGVIGFAAWSSFAHAAVMGTQVYRNVVRRQELIGVVVFLIIGVVLIALSPPKSGAGSVRSGGA